MREILMPKGVKIIMFILAALILGCVVTLRVASSDAICCGGSQVFVQIPSQPEKVIPPVPDWEKMSNDGGTLKYCKDGGMEEWSRGLWDVGLSYLRLVVFHGKVVAILRHHITTQAIEEAWVWSKPGEKPNEYYTGEDIKTKYPEGPCMLIPFHK